MRRRALAKRETGAYEAPADDLRIVRVRANPRGERPPVPVDGARLAVERLGDDGAWTAVDRWETESSEDAGGRARPVPHVAPALADGTYRVSEAATPKGHRPPRDAEFAVTDGTAVFQRGTGTVWEEGARCVCVTDGRRRAWPFVLAALLAMLAILSKLLIGTADPVKAAAVMADQVGITNNNAKAHMRVSGSTTFMSIPDVTWTAEAGEQPLTIVNPPTNVSTGKYFDIEPDAGSFVMDYESLPTGAEATCTVKLRATDGDGIANLRASPGRSISRSRSS